MSKQRGLVIVNTGNGKGKTTAALGIALRAWGHGQRVIVLQFIKSADRITGERLAAERLGIEVLALGDGFTWRSPDLDHSRELARDAWSRAAAVVTGGEYHIVVLDELTYPLQFLWLDVAEVVRTLAARPPHVHVVITGRAAPEALIAAADLVTEMREVRHPFHEHGLAAQQGVDF
ncbi:MAG: cob(I)yrinic acid a,c-diamide adenosyltransferase [Dehalococcoidia bacterium]